VDPTQVPEDLSDLADEELSELRDQIRESVESLAEEARNSDEVLGQVEGLISSFDQISEEISSRETAAAERSARLDAALERFGPVESDEAEIEADAEIEEAAAEEDEEADADSETEEAAVEDEVEVEIEEVVEAAIEEVVEEAAIEEAEAEFTPEAEATVEEAVEVEVEEFVAEAEEEVAEAAEADAEEFTVENDDSEFNNQEVTEVATSDNRPTVARLRERRPEAVAPRSDSQNGGAELVARGIGGNVTEGQRIDIPTLARSIVDKRIAMSGVPSGTFDKVTLASSVLDFGDNVVGGGAQENFSILRRVSEGSATFRNELNSLVASGGVCAPLEPDYDFFRLATEMDPVERCLGTVGAPRGGIRYIVPPDFRDAAPGVRVTTEAEDAAGYVSQGGPTPDKPCVAVECPAIQECRVDAVSRCVTFGNLNYRVFPEQVEAFLSDLSVIFTETKEIFYLDAIDAASTPVTAGPSPYGATRALVYDLLAAAANYRRRHHMAPDATLQVLLPSWVVEFIKVDMVNDHSLGLSFVDRDMAAINRFFAQANLDVCWYYDSATGAGQAFNDIQVAGGINQWPDTLVSYMFAPGTFVRLDAGTLDVGLIRDSALNGTNDLQLFAEQWVQVCMVGLESLRIEHTLCPTGAGPEPVPVLVCPEGVS
jgi:hypothetical protein